MRFAITKDFESANAKITGTKRLFELVKFSANGYTLIEHNGDSVTERADFTKEELRALWMILTTKQ